MEQFYTGQSLAPHLARRAAFKHKARMIAILILAAMFGAVYSTDVTCKYLCAIPHFRTPLSATIEAL